MEDALSPPSPELEHRKTKELRRKAAARLALFGLLTANSGLLTMYILWGDVLSVANAAMLHVTVGLVLGRRFGFWGPSTTDGGKRWRQLETVISFLLLSLGVLQLSRMARTAASSTSAPVLVAAAAAAALVVGGGCAYLLHRRTCAKEQRQCNLLAA